MKPNKKLALVSAFMMASSLCTTSVGAMHQMPQKFQLEQILQSMMQQDPQLNQEFLSLLNQGMFRLPIQELNSFSTEGLEKYSEDLNYTSKTGFIVKNNQGGYDVKLSQGEILHIDAIKTITRGKVIEKLNLDKKQITKQEIINFFTSDKVIYRKGNLEYNQEPTVQEKENFRQAMIKLITPLLDNPNHTTCMALFDVFIKVHNQKFKTNQDKLMIICNDQDCALSLSVTDNTIQIPFDSENEEFNIQRRYNTVPQYHPLYEQNACDTYTYTTNNLQEINLLKGIGFCHELGHLLAHWMKCNMDPSFFGFNNIQAQKALTFGADINVSQLIWTSMEEFRNIVGVLPIEQNGKTTLYVNGIFNELLMNYDCGLPIRWGHQGVNIEGTSIVPPRLLQFLPQYIDLCINTYKTNKQIKNLEQSIQRAKQCLVKTQLETKAKFDASPNDDQLKFLFAVNKRSKNAYEHNLNELKEQRKNMMLKQEESQSAFIKLRQLPQDVQDDVDMIVYYHKKGDKQQASALLSKQSLEIQELLASSECMK